MFLADVLQACITELRQMHTHIDSECKGGCPTMLAIRQAEAILGEKPLTWKEWDEGYRLSLSEFVPIGATVDEELVSHIAGVSIEELRNPVFRGVPGREQERYLLFPSDIAGSVNCGFVRKALGEPWYYAGPCSHCFQPGLFLL